MPTLEDLREALTAREAHAGDPDAVLHRVIAAPSGPRLAPLAAAAAVVLVGAVAAAVVLPGGHHAGRPEHQPGGGTDPSAWMSAGVSYPVSGPPATTAPPGTALTWSFSVAAVPGWTARRDSYTPAEQDALFSGADDSYATLAVYARGVAGPDIGGGEEVSIDGRVGFVIPDAANPAYPRLAWRYKPDSWAVLEVSAGTKPLDGATLRADQLQLARAVRFGTADPVRAPLRIQLPDRLAPQAVALDGSGACVGYGAGAYPEQGVAVRTDDLGSVLTVCRVPAGTDTSGYRASTDRIVRRPLPDGSVLELALNVNHLGEYSAAALQHFAATADTSPHLAAPATWLPLR